jgi:hypothetical protein
MLMVVTLRTRPRDDERPVSSLAGDDATQPATREKPSVTQQYRSIPRPTVRQLS